VLLFRAIENDDESFINSVYQFLLGGKKRVLNKKKNEKF